MRTGNALLNKSKVSSIRLIRLGQYLHVEKKEHVSPEQILCSRTSIGSNSKKSCRAIGAKIFVHKLNIALK
jgi:four helix bundle protein